MKNDISLRQIFLFLWIAFLLPLFCMVLISKVRLFQTGVLNFLLFGIQAMSPTSAAILSVLCFEKKEGLCQFLKKSYAKNINMKIVLLALILPVVLIGLAKLASWMTTGSTLSIVFPSTKKLFIIFWALIAEELGWRGFLQESLSQYFSNLTLPLVTGILWALWHYHFFLAGTMSVPVMLFALGCIGDSYIYFALTKLVKGNIIPASVIHTSENFCFNVFLIYPANNYGNPVPYALYLIFTFLAAIVLTMIIWPNSKKIKIVPLKRA